MNRITSGWREYIIGTPPVADKDMDLFLEKLQKMAFAGGVVIALAEIANGCSIGKLNAELGEFMESP